MNELSVKEFIDCLFSKEPIPGGGGASALVGAVSISLAGMVAGLTFGKKGYELYFSDLEDILKKARKIKDRLVELIDEDAKAYLEVSKVYKQQAIGTEEKKEKKERLEAALRNAAAPPMEMLEILAEATDMFFELGKKGTALALTDVSIGALLIEAAMKGAAMNVVVNTRLMEQKEVAIALENRVRELLSEKEGQLKILYDNII